MNKALILTIFFLSTYSILWGQDKNTQLTEEQIYRKGNKYNTWSVSAGFGPVIYYVDVIDYTVFPNDNWKFAPTIMLSKQFNRLWSADLQWMMADMYGQKNGRYFTGELSDFSINGTLNINQLAIFGPISDKWNIYAKLGFGLTYFRSRQFDLETNEPKQVQDIYENIAGYPTPHGWLPDDYLAIGYNRRGENAPYNKTKRGNEIVIPFGLGVKYRLSKSFDLGTEILMRNMNADNLDVNLSGADNDSYMQTSINLTYKIGKKNKRHAAWTYKDFNMNYKRQRKNDPMAQKLDSLKAQIALLAEMDTAIIDTSTIVTESIEYKEHMSASVFFEFDKSNITENAQITLAKVAHVMTRDKSIRIKIVGYCDERGSYDYNLKLSQRRCNAVLKILTDEYQIDRNRFELDYKGEAELLSDTQKLAPHGLHLVNRRVDLFVIIE